MSPWALMVLFTACAGAQDDTGDEPPYPAFLVEAFRGVDGTLVIEKRQTQGRICAIRFDVEPDATAEPERCEVCEAGAVVDLVFGNAACGIRRDDQPRVGLSIDIDAETLYIRESGEGWRVYVEGAATDRTFSGRTPYGPVTEGGDERTEVALAW